MCSFKDFFLLRIFVQPKEVSNKQTTNQKRKRTKLISATFCLLSINYKHKNTHPLNYCLFHKEKGENEL